MSALHAVVASVAMLRLAELIWARRNTARLLENGAHEIGAAHYPLFVVLHAGWLVALLIWVPADTAPRWPWLAAFIGLQGARLWVIASLGERWTTRIIVVPGAALVRRGPYRWLRHPNYAVVVAEIAVLPMAFGAWQVALIFSVANAALLTHRIRVENAALRDAGSAGRA